MPIYRTGDYADYQAALYAENKLKPAGPAPVAGLEATLFGKDGLTFGDLIDVINPLQHLPVVSTLYRKFTGDDISPAARVAGDGLFGGVIGLATSLVNVAVEQATGGDIGDHVLALVTGEDLRVPPADPVQTAAATVRADAGSGSDTPAPVQADARYGTATQGYQAAAAVTDPATGWLLDLRP